MGLALARVVVSHGAQGCGESWGRSFTGKKDGEVAVPSHGERFDFNTLVSNREVGGPSSALFFLCWP